MTEQHHAPEQTPVEDDIRTGLAEVDGVLDSVGALEDVPVAEHVSEFEKAHETLRRALDSAPADDSA